LAICERFEIILNRVRGKRVLHMGCADWPFTKEKLGTDRFLHGLLDDRASQLVGADLSRDGLSAMREFNEHWVLHHVDDEKVKLGEYSFDVIVASEVLEHVDNAVEFLEQLRFFMRDSTRLLLTVPNAQAVKSALRAFGDHEVTHPDHVSTYSLQTLQTLLSRVGLEVTSSGFYWSDGSSLKGRLASTVFRVLSSVFSERIADGLVVECKPRQ